MTRWLVVSPTGAGRFDGIGDYAARLAAALGHVTPTDLYVTGEGPWPAAAEVDAVFHQYSPAAPRGALWRKEGRWFDRVSRAGRPVIVTIHEYWPPPDGSLRRALSRARLRWRVRRVAARASAVVVAQEISAAQLRAAGVLGRRPVHVVPVGSNIAPVANPPGPRDGGLVLFGQAAAMDPPVMRALAQWRASAGSQVPLTWVSRSANEAREWWIRVAGGSADAVRWRGGLSESEISAQLQAATLGLAPYADGASARRTTLAALMQHGVPTVALQGVATDGWLVEHGGLALVPGAAPEAFVSAVRALLADAPRRAALSRAARSAYDTHMSWPTIADAYVRALAGGTDTQA
ncbi:MAG: glycosyltransferase [Acidobacteria bacterium]|nr:glycosyltransferase [Acidobacteriota bacterium]